MSNVIKSAQYVSLENIRTIELMKQQAAIEPSPDEDASDHISEEEAALSAVIEERDQLIRDAEAYAEELIAQASEQTARMQAEAQAEIERWWQQRRSEDERLRADAEAQGYDQGYREGIASAEQQVRSEHRQLLQEAAGILDHAHELKEQIIQEAEPFLLELSCSIAEKIIDKQLTLSPEWAIEYIKKLLGRRREQGAISLYVAPAQFAYIVDAKDELVQQLDFQAELHIVPDGSVADHGCVIRSSYGSIDARVDTQLAEIKKALFQIATGSEAGG